MKKVYQTNRDGFFVGMVLADKSPLEDDVWLIPAGCIEVAPPKMVDGQRARWTGKSWLVEDPPKPEPMVEHIPTKEEIASEVRAKRNDLLATSDWTRLDDAPVNKSAWAVYRKSLRDITLQAGFPENIIWPKQP
jgi:hypothetical protein